MKYQVLQGKQEITINLPQHWEVFDVPMPDETPIANAEEKLWQCLKKPLNSPPLSEIVKPGDQIAICVTDVSRPSPDNILLPPILQTLENAGIKRNDVTIIIGTGSHRAVTFEEMKVKFGYYACSNYRIVNHDSRDKLNLVDLGPASTGAPRVVNSILTKVNHIINVGVTELHQYAGYSGGAKTIAVGCAGEETIQYTHSASFLEKSGAVAGKVENNLFQQTLWEIVDPLPFDFLVNVILNEKGEILDLEAGHPKTVFDAMVKKAKQVFEMELEKCFDICYLGVPYPKDLNLYQATRAATYQALSERPVLKKGAIINLICSCQEGVGKGVGELRFKERMSKFPNPAAILLSMTGKQTMPGEQRAFMVAKAMMDFKINVFGTKINPEELRSMGFLQQKLVPDDLLRKELRALVMRDGMKMVLNLKKDEGNKS